MGLRPFLFHDSQRWHTHTLSLVRSLGDLALFVGRSFAAVVGSRKLFRRVLRSMFEQGVRCLPVIVIVGLFTGLVLGLKGYYVLHKFGSEGLLGTLVSLSIVRELGPVLAALMLVGVAPWEPGTLLIETPCLNRFPTSSSI